MLRKGKSGSKSYPQDNTAQIPPSRARSIGKCWEEDSGRSGEGGPRGSILGERVRHSEELHVTRNQVLVRRYPPFHARFASLDLTAAQKNWSERPAWAELRHAAAGEVCWPFKFQVSAIQGLKSPLCQAQHKASTVSLGGSKALNAGLSPRQSCTGKGRGRRHNKTGAD